MSLVDRLVSRFKTSPLPEAGAPFRRAISTKTRPQASASSLARCALSNGISSASATNPSRCCRSSVSLVCESRSVSTSATVFGQCMPQSLKAKRIKLRSNAKLWATTMEPSIRSRICVACLEKAGLLATCSSPMPVIRVDSRGIGIPGLNKKSWD